MKQIIVNVEDFEIKAALVEDNKLGEFFVQREDKKRVNGNIYKGRVANILPGMESAFVDIGLDKNAFLYVKDLREFEEKYLDGIKNSQRPIEDILNVGDEVIVQILKEPRDNKGARVTTHYTIPGKYLVLMPNNDYIAISQKIVDQEERKRLEGILNEVKPENVGVIIRTAAEGKSEIHFEKEIEYLIKKWNEIESQITKAKVGEILYKDNDLIKRIGRDIFSKDVDKLVIDNEEKYWELMDYLSAFSETSFRTKIELYDDKRPIFESYSVNAELEKALKETVWLDCGGYLVIQKTEALISIDVNTGKNTGSCNLEDTVLETNLEAAEEIPRQLRLRNLSGIIIIDFIDMKLDEDKKKVLEVLEKNLKKDRVKNNVIHFTDLGLVEMTRKRVGRPLSSYFLEECSRCGGTGYVKSKDVIIHDIINDVKYTSNDEDITLIKVLVGKELYSILNEIYREFINSYLKDKGKKFKLELAKDKDVEEYEVILEI